MVKNRAHLILLLLYAKSSDPNDKGTIEGITRLEKLIFLIDKESNLTDFRNSRDRFEFKPYLMGPFSPEIYDEVDFLDSLGLIEAKNKGQKSAVELVEENLFFSNQILDKYQKNETIESEEIKIFELTKQGRIIAENIFNALNNDQKEYLLNLKTKYGKMDLKELLKFIYKKYPTYASKSEIKEYLGIS